MKYDQTCFKAQKWAPTQNNGKKSKQQKRNRGQ